MRLTRIVAPLAGLSLCLAVSAQAQTPKVEQGSHQMRQFYGFETDAETTRGFWGELGGGYAAEDDVNPDIRQFLAFLRLAYGGEKWEAGAGIPYYDIHVDGGSRGDGWGDLFLWGKFLPVRTDRFTFGGGLTVTTPTGTIPGEEFRFEPFLTGAVDCGPLSIRPHVGYVASTGDDEDGIAYSLAALYPFAEVADFRAEIVGLHALDAPSSDANSISILPGFDLYAIEGHWQLMLRVAGGMGLTRESPNYQAGLSIVIAQAK